MNNVKQRATVGIIYRNTSDWTGGAYYILNLVRSFLFLPSEKQPLVVVFTATSEDFEWIKKNSGYARLQHAVIPKQITYNVWQRLCNRVSRAVTGKNIVEKRYTGKLDVLYPYSYDYFFDLVPNKTYWIPDFQEHYYPDFFSTEEVKNRKFFQQHVASGTYPVVFSSHAALSDFKKIYPNHTCATFVLNFASYTRLDELKTHAQLCEKYKLPEVFFYSPNQFWAHKNHRCVIHAVLLLKKRGVEATVAFSGKEDDYRNPGYFTELKKEVTALGLEKNILFLGFIDRSDVFSLMKHARAVVQPSLFEGWSTVVEDCKSVSGFILASDIAVHKEQLTENARFFSPHEPQQLAAEIKNLLENAPVRNEINYENNIKKFAADFMQLTEKLRAQ